MINVQGLLDAFDKDWDLIRELVTLCQEKVPEYVANIKKAVEGQNFEQLEHHAHKLKGSIAHFGCQEFYDCVYQLEVSGREKKAEPVAGLIKTLDELYQNFEKALVELKENMRAQQ